YLLRHLGAEDAGQGLRPAEERTARTARGRRGRDSQRARGEGRHIRGRDDRHRGLPHGDLQRPRRKRAAAAPPLRAVRVSDRLKVARDCYRAYETADRELVERCLSDDFTFYSPADVGIDRERYFERCWPNA